MSEMHIDYFRDPLSGDIVQDADFRPLTVKRSHPPGHGEPLSVTHLLERVATALEEQNRIQSEWIALQQTRHKEDEERDIGPQIVAIHRENQERDQAWREDLDRKIEKQVRFTGEMIREAHAAYLQHLKEQSEHEEAGK